MTGPGPCPPELASETTKLLNRVLREGHPPTLREEYPLVFREENAQNNRVVIEDGRVMSHAAFLPVDFQVDGFDLKLGLIGSVATHPDAQGRGHGSAVLTACEEGIRDLGGSVAILWSEDDRFYSARGYVRAGLEDLFVIPTGLLRRRNDRSGVRPAKPTDVHALTEIHGTLRARAIRPPHDWKALLGIPRMDTLVFERDGQVVAYACCGKGADFENVVHEWAGPTEEALDLVLEHALRGGRDEIVLLSPPYTGRIRRVLRERGIPAHRGALGMMKIVDARAFAEQINQFFATANTPAGEIEPRPDGTFRVTSAAGVEEMDSAQLLHTVFGSEDEEVEEGRGIQGLPLPLYLRGLDSV